jgi:voltage-gated potassium channel
MFSTYRYLFDKSYKEGVAVSLERFIGTLIALSTLAVVLEHVPDIESSHALALHGFDVLAVAIFSVEYVLRVLTARHDPEYAHQSWPTLRYLVSFYALVDLLAIAPFYVSQWVALDVESMRALRMLRLIRMFKFSRQLLPAWHEFQTLNQGQSFRAKVYALMEPSGHSGRLHFYLDNFIVFWIALSIICVVLESVQSVHEVLSVQFAWVDTLAFSVFTLEYLARAYAAPESPKFKALTHKRLGHVLTFQALVDLITILPFFLEHFLPYPLDLRFLRIFRLSRMLKLTRYTSATDTLVQVLKREWPVIFSSIFVLLLLIVMTASLGYLLEHDAQPDVFTNIPEAIYWAMTTLSSIGYGDMTPITPLGRAVTSVIAIVGVGIFALPAGLLASAFSDQLQINRDQFKAEIKKSVERGGPTRNELTALSLRAEELHVSNDELTRLIKNAADIFKSESMNRLDLSHLILDAKKNPELAAEQFHMLVSQLALINSAIGYEKLLIELEKGGDSSLAILKVLESSRSSS